jgi:hypothetical protein
VDLAENITAVTSIRAEPRQCNNGHSLDFSIALYKLAIERVLEYINDHSMERIHITHLIALKSNFD